jgi:cytochrome bd-type quinol oxidase subunit 2
MNKLGKLVLTLFGLLAPASTLAVNVVPPAISGLPGDQNSTVTRELMTLIDTALVVAGLIAVAFLIYGGFRYITSAGNDEVAEGAKKTIQNAIIGLVVIILSYVIIAVITNALIGGPSAT